MYCNLCKNVGNSCHVIFDFTVKFSSSCRIYFSISTFQVQILEFWRLKLALRKRDRLLPKRHSKTTAEFQLFFYIFLLHDDIAILEILILIFLNFHAETRTWYQTGCRRAIIALSNPCQAHRSLNKRYTATNAQKLHLIKRVVVGMSGYEHVEHNNVYSTN